MELPTTIVSALTVVGALALLTAYYARGRGVGTIKLLETNIQAYKDAEKLKDQRIAYLEGQLTVKEETIKRLLNDTK